MNVKWGPAGSAALTRGLCFVEACLGAVDGPNVFAVQCVHRPALIESPFEPVLMGHTLWACAAGVP